MLRGTEVATIRRGHSCDSRSGAVWTHSSGEAYWLARHRRHWQPVTTTFPRFGWPTRFAQWPTGFRTNSRGSALAPVPRSRGDRDDWACVCASAMQVGNGRYSPQRSHLFANSFAGGARAQHTAPLGFVVVPRRIQRAKKGTRLRRRGDSQTPCGNDAGPPSCPVSVPLDRLWPGTVELQRTHVPCARFQELLKELKRVGRHSISNETRFSIPRNRSGRHGAVRASSCVPPSAPHTRYSRHVRYLATTPNDSSWRGCRKQCSRRKAGTDASCLETHHIKRSSHAAAHQAPVLRGQFFAEIGFGIGKLTKNTGTQDNFGAMWLLVKLYLSNCCPYKGEQAWQRMIVGWFASQLVRGLFIVFPNSETMSGVHSMMRIWRSALQVHCPCLVVVPQGFSLAPANYIL